MKVAVFIYITEQSVFLWEEAVKRQRNYVTDPTCPDYRRTVSHDKTVELLPPFLSYSVDLPLGVNA